MTDERYARHVALPEIGEAGQRAVLAATARLIVSEPAGAIAGAYLAAAGVGEIVEQGDGREVALPTRPAWWPAAPGDEVALDFWRGAIAATAWLDAVIAT